MRYGADRKVRHMNVEQSLRALAADDATAQVPQHVDAAVMAAWDENCREHHGRAPAARRKRVVLGIAMAGAFAASLVAAAVVITWRGGSEARHTLENIAPEKSVAPEVPEVVAGATAPPRGVEQPMAPARARRRPVASPAAGAAYILVPDAYMDAPLMMMRVRMPRSAFSRLGVPIANPDGDGMVDVEMLVGEDGVARSIRRATAVGWVEAN
jgi:hypothetical protein